MRWRRLALVACVLAAACDRDAKLPDDEIAIIATSAAAEVDLGRAFEVTVVRRFSRDLEPDPWSDQALWPLVVRPLGTTRRMDDRHVEETRAFRAYAFEPGSLAIPGLSFRAVPKSGGPPRLATCDGFTVRVKTVLDAKAPGPPQLPGDPPPERRRAWIWIAAALAVLAAAGHLVRSSRRARAAAPAPPLPPPSAEESARERLARLRALDARSREEVRAFHLELSAALREWIAGRFAIGALEMTTEEILDSGPIAAALPAAQRARLFEVLGDCDLVKFADRPSAPEDRERLLAASESLLR